MATLTPVQILTIVSRAISLMLTGQPAVSTFKCAEVDQAWDIIRKQARTRRGTPECRALGTATTVLVRLYWHLENSTRLRPVGPKKLQEAAPVIARLLDEAIRAEDAYWQEFSEWAADEADRIIEEAQAEG